MLIMTSTPCWTRFCVRQNSALKFIIYLKSHIVTNVLSSSDFNFKLVTVISRDSPVQSQVKAATQFPMSHIEFWGRKLKLNLQIWVSISPCPLTFSQPTANLFPWLPYDPSLTFHLDTCTPELEGHVRGSNFENKMALKIKIRPQIPIRSLL